MKMTINKAKAKKIDKVLKKAMYNLTSESDVTFKDEGDMTTVCFVSDKAKSILKTYPIFNDLNDHVYGEQVLKIDIDSSSVRNMIAWAVSHKLSANFN